MEENVDKLDIINHNLKEILMWLRFANILKLKQFLEVELDIDGKKLVYEYSNGIRSSTELAKLSSVPERTIINWWQRWYRQGVVVEGERYKKRMSNIVSLADVGIKIPKMPYTSKRDNSSSENSEVSNPPDSNSAASKDDVGSN